MSDTPNAADTADAPKAGQPAELKSKSTATFQPLKSEADKAKPEAKATSEKPNKVLEKKAEPKAEPLEADDDADDAADQGEPQPGPP